MYKIKFAAPSRGRHILFTTFAPPSMAPLTAGVRPFIYPDAGPTIRRSENTPVPAFRSKVVPDGKVVGNVLAVYKKSFQVFVDAHVRIEIIF